MSCNQTSFLGIVAVDSGGALGIGNNSTVSWCGLATSFNNTGDSAGGAVDDGSRVF